MSKEYGITETNNYFILSKDEMKCKKIKSESSRLLFYNNILFESDDVAAEVSEGQWVEIKKTENTISFNYDTLPKESKLEGIKEGELYFFRDSLESKGSLTSYTTLHELESGLYYLSFPGFFYNTKTSLDTLFKSKSLLSVDCPEKFNF